MARNRDRKKDARAPELTTAEINALQDAVLVLRVEGFSRSAEVVRQLLRKLGHEPVE